MMQEIISGEFNHGSPKGCLQWYCVVRKVYRYQAVGLIAIGRRDNNSILHCPKISRFEHFTRKLCQIKPPIFRKCFAQARLAANLLPHN
jgi:hypothetical protein